MVPADGQTRSARRPAETRRLAASPPRTRLSGRDELLEQHLCCIAHLTRARTAKKQPPQSVACQALKSRMRAILMSLLASRGARALRAARCPPRASAAPRAAPVRLAKREKVTREAERRWCPSRRRQQSNATKIKTVFVGTSRVKRKPYTAARVSSRRRTTARRSRRPGSRTRRGRRGRAEISRVGPGFCSFLQEPNAAEERPTSGRRYTVLGVETSCDDTAAAVVRSDGIILGEAVASQHEVHAAYGGVVPGLAKNAHEAAIDGVVRQALENAGLRDVRDVDAVAATVGPGLEICLRVGARAAARLASEHAKPFLHAHHLEAHCLVARLPGGGGGADDDAAAPAFPFLALLVSGGHCQLLWVRGVGACEVLGGTLDDALGEAYDKAARMLGLSGPTGGGPALERAAVAGNATAVPLPIPMRQKKTCDFSYGRRRGESPDGEPRRRRGRDVSAEARRGGGAAASWKVRGDEARRRRRG